MAENQSMYAECETHTSLLIEAFANIKEIQCCLWHNDISITLNIYSHLTEPSKKISQSIFQITLKQNNLQDKKTSS